MEAGFQFCSNFCFEKLISLECSETAMDLGLSGWREVCRVR